MYFNNERDEKYSRQYLKEMISVLYSINKGYNSYKFKCFRFLLNKLIYYYGSRPNCYQEGLRKKQKFLRITWRVFSLHIFILSL